MNLNLIRASGVLALGVLASCEPGPPSMDLDAIHDRAVAVRSCKNGDVIGLDPMSKRYIYVRQGIVGSQGLIARGVTPAEFCQ